MELTDRAWEAFGAEPALSRDWRRTVARCGKVVQGRPEWLDGDPDGGVRTVNFARSVCVETARLTVQGVGMTVTGSPRAAWLQKQADRWLPQLRHWVECACGCGTVILKPNGRDVDVLTPERFLITECRGASASAAVFSEQRLDRAQDRYYTRLEYHRFLPDGRYAVSNRCTVGDTPSDRGKPVPIGATPWAGLAEETVAEGLERPLFAVLRMPSGCWSDPVSPVGMPVFADALEELRDLDVAYSRNASEIFDSIRLALLDDRVILPPGAPEGAPRRWKLPRFVRKAFGSGASDLYQEIDPALHTDTRLKGIDALLSQIGFKCGFSNGYFVFDQSSGLKTATQVEADDRRTIQLIMDVRDKLRQAIADLLYAQDALADACALAPAGPYTATFDFGDITYNREEDRTAWWGYVTQGKIEPWRYFVKFEGMSEEEARAVQAEAERGA